MDLVVSHSLRVTSPIFWSVNERMKCQEMSFDLKILEVNRTRREMEESSAGIPSLSPHRLSPDEVKPLPCWGAMVPRRHDLYWRGPSTRMPQVRCDISAHYSYLHFDLRYTSFMLCEVPGLVVEQIKHLLNQVSWIRTASVSTEGGGSGFHTSSSGRVWEWMGLDFSNVLEPGKPSHGWLASRCHDRQERVRKRKVRDLILSLWLPMSITLLRNR